MLYMGIIHHGDIGQQFILPNFEAFRFGPRPSCLNATINDIGGCNQQNHRRAGYGAAIERESIESIKQVAGQENPHGFHVMCPFLPKRMRMVNNPSSFDTSLVFQLWWNWNKHKMRPDKAKYRSKNSLYMKHQVRSSSFMIFYFSDIIQSGCFHSTYESWYHSRW